jgi:hypothetical protein
MKGFTLPSAILAGIVIALLQAAPAQAQATRTWVSGVGDDANPCSRTAPCKTFAGAISKTAPGGSINVLDPGGFGGVTITKSITIRGDGVEAGVLVAGTNAIIVAAGANDRVTLEGLDIEGVNSGVNGIRFLTGKELYVIKCRIRQFATFGFDMQNSTVGAHAFIHDSFIYDNTAGGVNVKDARSTVAFGSSEVMRMLRVTPFESVPWNSRINESSSSTQTVAVVNADDVVGLGVTLNPWAAWPSTVLVPMGTMSYFARGACRKSPVKSIGTDERSVAARLTTCPGVLAGK